jgi:hypothetical protein
VGSEGVGVSCHLSVTTEAHDGGKHFLKYQGELSSAGRGVPAGFMAMAWGDWHAA